MADRLTGQEDTNDNQYAFYNSQTGQIEYHNADNPFVQQSIQSGTPIYFDDYGNWISKTAYDVYQHTGAPAQVSIEMAKKEDGSGYDFNIDAPQAWLDTAQGQSVIQQIQDYSDYDYIANPELADKVQQAITSFNNQIKEGNQYINDLVAGNEEIRANDTTGMLNGALLDVDQINLWKQITNPEGKLEINEEGITEESLRKQFGDDIINKIFEEDGVRYINNADIVQYIKEMPLKGSYNPYEYAMKHSNGDITVDTFSGLMNKYNMGFDDNGVLNINSNHDFARELVEKGLAWAAYNGDGSIKNGTVMLKPDVEIALLNQAKQYEQSQADAAGLDDTRREYVLGDYDDNIALLTKTKEATQNAQNSGDVARIQRSNIGIKQDLGLLKLPDNALNYKNENYAALYLSEDNSALKVVHNIYNEANKLAGSGQMDDKAFNQYIMLTGLADQLANANGATGDQIGGFADVFGENAKYGFRKTIANNAAFMAKLVTGNWTIDDTGDRLFDKKFGEEYSTIYPELMSTYSVVNSKFTQEAGERLGVVSGAMLASMPEFMIEGKVISGAVKGVAGILETGRAFQRGATAINAARNLRWGNRADNYVNALAQSRRAENAALGVTESVFDTYNAVRKEANAMYETADVFTRANRVVQTAKAAREMNAVDKIAQNLRRYDISYENASSMMDAAINIERATRGAQFSTKAFEAATNAAKSANQAALKAADTLRSSVFASGMDSAQLISYGIRNLMKNNNIIATSSKAAATTRILANMAGEVGQGIIYTAMEATVSEDARSLEGFLEGAVGDAALSIIFHAPGNIHNFRSVKKLVNGVQEEVNLFNKSAARPDQIKFTPDTVRAIKARIYQRTMMNENIDLTPELIDEMTQWLKEDGGAVAGMNKIVGDNAVLLAEGRANAKSSTVSETIDTTSKSTTETADNVVEGNITENLAKEAEGNATAGSNTEQPKQEETPSKQSLTPQQQVLDKTNIKKQQKVDNPDGTQYTINTMDKDKVTTKYDEDSLEDFEFDNIDEDGWFDVELGSDRTGNFKADYWEGYKQGVTEYAKGFEIGQLRGMRVKDKLQQDSLKRRVRRGTANPRFLKLESQDFISQNGTMEIRPLEGRYRQTVDQFKIDRSNHWGTFKFDDVSEMLHGKTIETISDPQQYANKMIDNGVYIDEALEWLDKYNESIKPTTLTAEQQEYIREFRQAVKDGKLNPSKQMQLQADIEEGYAKGVELGSAVRLELNDYFKGLNQFIEDQMINHGKVPGLRKEIRKVRKERKAQQKGDK